MTKDMSSVALLPPSVAIPSSLPHLWPPAEQSPWGGGEGVCLNLESVRGKEGQKGGCSPGQAKTHNWGNRFAS